MNNSDSYADELRADDLYTTSEMYRNIAWNIHRALFTVRTNKYCDNITYILCRIILEHLPHKK